MQKINYITPTLLNSWLYVTKVETANIKDFLNTLEKKTKKTTKAQLKGLEFEDEVYKGNKEIYNEFVKNGLYQVKVKRPYKDIMLIGIIDVLQPNHIYDIKTTNKYELGKYYNTSQHKLYPYCTGIYNFSYLINEECYKEDYTYQNGECEQLVDDFILWLKKVNLYDVWQKHWVKEEKEIENW